MKSLATLARVVIGLLSVAAGLSILGVVFAERNLVAVSQSISAGIVIVVMLLVIAISRKLPRAWRGLEQELVQIGAGATHLATNVQEFDEPRQLAKVLRATHASVQQNMVQRARLDSIIRASSDYAVVCDSNWRITEAFVSERQARQEGFEGKEWIGQLVTTLLPEFDVQAGGCSAGRELLVDPSHMRLELRSDHSVPVRVVSSDLNLSSSTSQRYLVLLQDCREEQAMEQRLESGRKVLAGVQLQVLKSRAEREMLERNLLSIAESEQERLGRELHDGVGQQLAGAAFLAKALAFQLDAGGSALAPDAEWIKEMLQHCVESVRSLSRQLSPTELERGALRASLERLCSDVRRSYGIQCAIAAESFADPLCESLDANTARHLYRVTQEALNNATRHGGCANIEVRLDVCKARLRLAIIDDGIGPKPGTLHKLASPGIGLSGVRTLLRSLATPSGIGLRSMRLRAASLGGSLRFGRRHALTIVVMRVPLEMLAARRPER